jgi:hypothetical protein
LQSAKPYVNAYPPFLHSYNYLPLSPGQCNSTVTLIHSQTVKCCLSAAFAWYKTHTNSWLPLHRTRQLIYEQLEETIRYTRQDVVLRLSKFINVLAPNCKCFRHIFM